MQRWTTNNAQHGLPTVASSPRPKSLLDSSDKCIRAALLLDKSRSMSELVGSITRIDVAKTASQAFVQDLFARQPESEVAIVTFNTDARALSGFCRSQDASILMNELAAQVADLSTNIGSALEIAESLFLGAGMDVGRNCVIRLLTDGHNQCGPDPVPIAQRLKSLGVTIETVGFANTESEVDSTLLKAIANADATGATHYTFYRNARHLVRDYRAAARRLTR